MHLDGSCHCKSITYEIDTELMKPVICHCIDCQIFSGSPFRFRVIVPSNSLQILTGNPRIYTKKTSASGAHRLQYFCEICGTHIYGAAQGVEVVAIQGGTIRQREKLTPVVQVWCQTKLAWVEKLAEIDQVEQQNLQELFKLSKYPPG